MTIEQFLVALKRRVRRNRTVFVTMNGALRTAALGPGSSYRLCPLAYMAHGSMSPDACALHLGLSRRSAWRIADAADAPPGPRSQKDRLRRKLLSICNIQERRASAAR